MISAFGEIWRNPYVRVVAALVLAYVLYRLLAWSRPVWGSFLVAYVIAFLLHPLLDWFVRRGLGRGLGLLSVVVGVLGVLGLLWLLGVRVAAQFGALAEELPGLVETFRNGPFLLARAVDPGYGEVFQRVFSALAEAEATLTSQVGPFVQSIPGWLLDWVLQANTGAVLFLGVLVLSFYLLYDFRRYNRAFLRAVPDRYRGPVAGSVQRVGEAVAGYVRGQVLVATVVGIVIGTGLAIIGVPLALMVGVISFLGNLIPFVGPIIAAVPSILLAFTVGFVPTLLTMALLLAVQMLDGNVLTPMIYSRVINLDKVTVLFAVLIGTVLFGLVGALLAVPVAVTVTMLYQDLYLQSDWYEAEEEPEPEPEPPADTPPQDPGGGLGQPRPSEA